MTSAQNVFVEFHVLRSFPPSNLNRDDLGSPKSALFGDVRRLRISSQCLKRTWRTSAELTGAFADTELGVRTAHLPTEVLKQLGESITAEHKEGLLALLGLLGRKNAKAEKASDDDSDEDEVEAKDAETDSTPEEGTQTAHLLFLSRQEIELVAKFAKENAEKLTKAFKTTGKKKQKDTDALKKLREALGSFLSEHTKRNAVDVGLFGRFITSDELDTIDGALHVAHGLGTQKVDVEYDYFTAVDDLAKTTGAGHLGESEFASSVMYLYACCDLGQLQQNLGERSGTKRAVDSQAIALAAKSLGAIARAMALATPTGKRTGTAPYTPAEFIEVVVRRTQPISYANAFTSAVTAKADGDVMDGSIKKLVDRREKLETAFSRSGDVEARYVLSLRDVAKGDQTSLSQLAEALEKKLSALGKVSA